MVAHRRHQRNFSENRPGRSEKLLPLHDAVALIDQVPAKKGKFQIRVFGRNMFQHLTPKSMSILDIAHVEERKVLACCCGGKAGRFTPGSLPTDTINIFCTGSKLPESNLKTKVPLVEILPLPGHLLCPLKTTAKPSGREYCTLS